MQLWKVFRNQVRRGTKLYPFFSFFSSLFRRAHMQVQVIHYDCFPEKHAGFCKRNTEMVRACACALVVSVQSQSLFHTDHTDQVPMPFLPFSRELYDRNRMLTWFTKILMTIQNGIRKHRVWGKLRMVQITLDNSAFQSIPRTASQQVSKPVEQKKIFKLLFPLKLYKSKLKLT